MKRSAVCDESAAAFLTSNAAAAKRNGGVMQGEIPKEQWQVYLEDFSKRNAGRTADLQVLSEELGTQDEAETLPFEGITLETKGSAASSVEIMLGGAGAADDRNLTHTIPDVRLIVPKVGPDGREEALEIEGADGAKTILVFKALPEIAKAAS
jgi:hypothetical protein